MRKLAWRFGDAVTVTILDGIDRHQDGTFYEIDGRYLRIQLSTAIPCGSLVWADKPGGDMVLGEAAHRQSNPQDGTIVDGEHVLFADSLTGFSVPNSNLRTDKCS
jgi:hypothetical protein